jgi:electron transfer flavoprotein beta subunit
VLSVEASVARRRRASLRDALAAERAPVEAQRVPVAVRHTAPAVVAPFRPRARVLPPPPGSSALDRVRQLIDVDSAPSHGEVVELDPPRAAQRIADALREWGYLPAEQPPPLSGRGTGGH